MPEYLVKIFDPKGHIRDRFPFAVPADQDAEAVLREISITGPKELWCGQRLVVARPNGSQVGAPLLRKGRLLRRLRHLVRP